MKMEEFFGGPERIYFNNDGNALLRSQAHTVSVEIGLPFPEDMESAIIWVLTREFRGFYFIFKTHIPNMGSLPPTRVLSARVWFSGKENEEALYREMKGRMKELVAMAPSFFSPSSFLANLSNRDFLHSIVKEPCLEKPEDIWRVWESGK